MDKELFYSLAEGFAEKIKKEHYTWIEQRSFKKRKKESLSCFTFGTEKRNISLSVGRNSIITCSGKGIGEKIYREAFFHFLQEEKIEAFVKENTASTNRFRLKPTGEKSQKVLTWLLDQEAIYMDSFDHFLYACPKHPQYLLNVQFDSEPIIEIYAEHLLEKRCQTQKELNEFIINCQNETYELERIETEALKRIQQMDITSCLNKKENKIYTFGESSLFFFRKIKENEKMVYYGRFFDEFSHHSLTEFEKKCKEVVQKRLNKKRLTAVFSGKVYDMGKKLLFSIHPNPERMEERFIEYITDLPKKDTAMKLDEYLKKETPILLERKTFSYMTKEIYQLNEYIIRYEHQKIHVSKR